MPNRASQSTRGTGFWHGVKYDCRGECQRCDWGACESSFGKHANPSSHLLGSAISPSVSPFQFDNKTWLLWELIADTAEDTPPRPDCIATDMEGVQLRFDRGETLTSGRQTEQPNVVKIDRGQAILTLEAEVYRNAVKRMTSLIGQLDLLSLLTTRLELRLSAASELQPLLKRAVFESKEVSESLLELHSLHRGYTSKLQWCDLTETLNRCITAMMRDMAEYHLKINRQNDTQQYLLHVDKIAFSRAIFWMIDTAASNLSKSAREMTLRSDFVGDELKLQIVYRREEAAANPASQTDGVLRFDDRTENHAETKTLPVHSPLRARWSVDNRSDGFSLFELFVRCNHKEL